MGNYLLAYHGGSMPESDAEREAAMAAWGAWFGALGGNVVDAGNPLAGSATISPAGSVSDGATSGLSGYSIIASGSLSEATQSAKGCPLLAHGGTVEVHEIYEVM